MNTLCGTCKNFIAAKNSEKIRRALSHQNRTYADEEFNSGDGVYFKRKDFKGWKGHGVFLGKRLTGSISEVWWKSLFIVSIHRSYRILKIIEKEKNQAKQK